MISFLDLPLNNREILIRDPDSMSSLPFVFYHGEKDWDLGKSFQERSDWKNLPEDLLSYIPNFKIELFELKPKGRVFETENLALSLFLRLIQIIRENGEQFEGELLRLFAYLRKKKNQ